MLKSNGHQNVPKPAAIKFPNLDVTLRRKVRKSEERGSGKARCTASRLTLTRDRFGQFGFGLSGREVDVSPYSFVAT
jgi:hypothetical protein